MSTFIGVDVSRYQGNIDYDQLAQAVSFVIYKGTGADSGLYVDGEFLRNHAQARSHNMHRGIYHFGGGTDAVTEANYFYQQCLTNLVTGEIPILDAEYGNALNPDWCLLFLQTLENLVGFKPMIYMNHNLMVTKDWSKVAAANYGLWLADWDGDPNAVVSMKYWAFCAIQQYTDAGQVAGIAGSVDEDGFFAPSIDFFDKYGKPAPAPAPQPVVTTQTVTETKVVPFQTQKEDDNTLPTGQTKTTRTGVNGVETLTYLVTYTDGNETSRTLQSDVVTTPAVDEIVSIGTYVAPTPDPTPTPTPTPTPSGNSLWAKLMALLQQIFSAFKANNTNIFQLRDGSTTTKRKLDRIVEFDEKSRGYDIKDLVKAKVPRNRHWTCSVTLDQGEDGSCVGNGWAHELIATPAVNIVDETFAVQKIYWEAQKIDEYPGGEYPGGDGSQGSSVLAGAKVVQKMGYMKEYRWCFTFDDLVLALGYNSPVVLGINWYAGMENPDKNGFIHKTGALEGGHCILAVGVDVKNQFVWLHNSWGANWGQDGEVKISFSDLKKLLAEQGEACVPIAQKVLK